MVLNDGKNRIWVGEFLLFEDQGGLKISTSPFGFFQWFDYLLVAQGARHWGLAQRRFIERMHTREWNDRKRA